jgi:hypothetical protein
VRLLLATLCLNETEHLPALVRQHRDWPGLAEWCFVEASDRVYAIANPRMVSDRGLSVDGTSEFLRSLAQSDDRVRYLPLGVVSHPDPAQGKCVARQAYLDAAEVVKPDYVWILDADEAYSRSEQLAVNAALCRYGGVALQQRHVWAPPGSGLAPFRHEVVGGYWDVPHPRGWRWRRGQRYATNHNLPAGVRCEVLSRGQAPACVHLGFASSLTTRRSKHLYYQARGEGRLDRRGPYVQSRAAWEVWREGDPLPFGARLVPWDESLTPEVFREGVPR